LLCAAIALAADVAKMDGWRDHGLFYYAPRQFLHGRNAYDWEAMKAAWRADGKPAGIDPGATISGFVTPPSMALLTLPPALAPPQFGFRAIELWNLAALAACLLFLTADAASRWPLEARLLFAAFVLTLPIIASVLLLGQSTLIICACLCAAIYFLRRASDNRFTAAAGVAVGLALAKFTLSAPFLGLLAYRRKWLALTACAVTFLLANIAMALPGGVIQPFAQFRAAISRESGPGTPFDAITSNRDYMPNSIIHVKRLLYLALGDRRSLIERVNLGLSILMAAAMGWAMRTRAGRPQSMLEPLEIVLLTVAGLVLFYHRTYDLAALMIAGYALVDEGMRGADRRTPVWWVLVALLLIATRSATLVHAMGRWLQPHADPSVALCWCNCLLLVAMFGLCIAALSGQKRSASAMGAVD
jgi:hypothetical protein